MPAENASNSIRMPYQYVILVCTYVDKKKEPPAAGATFV